MRTLSLAGEWRAVEFDMPFTLPGSANENKIGTPQQEFTVKNKESLRSLRQRYNYTGPLTLTRNFYLPEDFEGKHLTLFLERVNIASELWIDDVKIGRQIIEITTPHTYDLTGKISVGMHTITLRMTIQTCLTLTHSQAVTAVIHREYGSESSAELKYSAVIFFIFPIFSFSPARILYACNSPSTQIVGHQRTEKKST